ncbi:hypothetical protein LMG9446_0122 [Lactococcus lactis subsp. lactis]|nr:hypothetical protein LMG9446_0122 [Lactococcus lactis subsp. lactis]
MISFFAGLNFKRVFENSNTLFVTVYKMKKVFANSKLK